MLEGEREGERMTEGEGEKNPKEGRGGVFSKRREEAGAGAECIREKGREGGSEREERRQGQ